LLVTDDADLHGRARLLRSHGMTTLTWDRHQGHAADYDVTARGFNFRLDEVRATIGLVQLERLAAENEARKQVVARYRSRLADTSLVLPFAAHTEDVRPSFHLAVVVFPSPGRRDAARQLL